jgi:hypothetical protein
MARKLSSINGKLRAEKKAAAGCSNLFFFVAHLPFLPLSLFHLLNLPTNPFR